MARKKKLKSNQRSSSSRAYYRFLDDETEAHYDTIHQKGVILERRIDFPSIPAYPRMRLITEACRWMNFNNMISDSNISWVEEFYANAYGHAANDYI
ncbi:hypothetical protein A2U01_0017237 [Trifolium medium]|uniref:Uncharacterized protein n=1 Tax=Trifolium medium TaxID=97028 RepID=A0A392N9G4_9FABA|nr:hypothetical protein [Trifolium medium]